MPQNLPPQLAAAIQQSASKYGVPPQVLAGIWRIESGSSFPNPYKNSLGYGGLFGTKQWNAPVQVQADTAASILGRLIKEKGNLGQALLAYSGGGYSSVPGAGPVHLRQGGGAAPVSLPATGQSVPGTPPARPMPQAGNGIAALLERATPSPTDIDILNRLGGTAGKVAQSSADQLPDLLKMAGAAPSVGASPGGAGASPTPQQGTTSTPPVPMLPVSGLNGNAPMVFSHGHTPYSNLVMADHVDWQHINPRLLDLVNKQLKKMGVVGHIISGYRSNQYSQHVGGFAGDPHTKGIAIDIYVGGHPIGQVIPPDVWAKLGITSGATPGFYKGKPDPEHLQLTGIPHKGK